MKRAIIILLTAILFISCLYTISAASEDHYQIVAMVHFESPGDRLYYEEAENAPDLYEGMRVYVVGDVSFRGLYKDIEYTVVRIDENEHTLRLEDSSGYPAYDEDEYATRPCFIGIKEIMTDTQVTDETNTEIPGEITDLPDTPDALDTLIPPEDNNTGMWNKIKDEFKNEFSELSENIKSLKDEIDGKNTVEVIDYIKDKIIPIIATVFSFLCAIYLAVVPAINKMKNAAERIKTSADGFDASALANEEAKRYIEEVAKNDIERIAVMNEKIDTMSEGYKKLFDVLYLVICNSDELVRKGIAENIAKDLNEFKKGEGENEEENTDKCENCDV